MSNPKTPEPTTAESLAVDAFAKAHGESISTTYLVTVPAEFRGPVVLCENAAGEQTTWALRLAPAEEQARIAALLAR